MSNIIRIGNGKSAVKISNICDSSNEVIESKEDFFKRQLDEAYKQGFEEGKIAAFNELEKEFTKRLALRSEQFEDYIKSINEKIEEYERSLENILLELAFLFSEKIIKREIAKESTIVEAIKSSANKLAGAVKIVIKLNPQDYEFIKETNSNILSGESFSKIVFEKDDKIAAGGCIVESEIGNVDARINSQFSELKQKIFSNLIPDFK